MIKTTRIVLYVLAYAAYAMFEICAKEIDTFSVWQNDMPCNRLQIKTHFWNQFYVTILLLFVVTFHCFIFGIYLFWAAIDTRRMLNEEIKKDQNCFL